MLQERVQFCPCAFLYASLQIEEETPLTPDLRIKCREEEETWEFGEALRVVVDISNQDGVAS